MGACMREYVWHALSLLRRLPPTTLYAIMFTSILENCIVTHFSACTSNDGESVWHLCTIIHMISALAGGNSARQSCSEALGGLRVLQRDHPVRIPHFAQS